MNRRRSSTLTGATPVTTLFADLSQMGDQMTYIATAGGQQITNGSNLKLAADWVTSAAGDTLTLVCDGVNWYEIGRKPQATITDVGSYRRLLERGGVLAGGTGSGTRYLLRSGTPVAATAATASQALLKLDPTKYPAPAGKTLKLCVFAACFSNNTDSTVTFTFGLQPGGSPAGASGTISFTPGTLVSGSTVALTPGANGSPDGNSGDFTFPTAGDYALRVVSSGAQAAGGDVDVWAALEWRHV